MNEHSDDELDENLPLTGDGEDEEFEPDVSLLNSTMDDLRRQEREEPDGVELSPEEEDDPLTPEEDDLADPGAVTSLGENEPAVIDIEELYRGLDRKRLVEAILFLEPSPASLRDIAAKLNLGEEEVAGYISELTAEYTGQRRGMEIIEIANGFQIVARREYTDKIFRVRAQKKARPKFNRAALETLAIIAYRQNITRVEIDAIRGVNSAGALKTLLAEEMIKITGRKSVLGNPLQYGTTEKFLEYFGLKSLVNLPKLKELKELDF